MENGTSSSSKPAACRIGEAAWQKYIQQGTVPRDFMNKLVLRYLVEQGHRAAAEQFCRESGSVPDVELRYKALFDFINWKNQHLYTVQTLTLPGLTVWHQI
jgi:LisH